MFFSQNLWSRSYLLVCLRWFSLPLLKDIVFFPPYPLYISTIHHHHNYPGQIFPFLRFCPKPDIYRCPCEMYLSLLIHLSHHIHESPSSAQWPAWIRSGFPSASRGAPWSRVRRWSPNRHTPRLPWSFNFFHFLTTWCFFFKFLTYIVFFNITSQKSSNLNVKTKLKHLKKTVKWNPTNMLLFFTLNPIKTAAINFGLWDFGDLWDP